ncbi:MAG: metallophosphoesterase [Verrucomicrobiales bacterium]|nr:metallophosphoesterase [Verrucomicrobiales bacterium]
MPVHLIPSRRRFLHSATGAVLSAAAIDLHSETTGGWVALLADTHIDADPAKEARGATMAKNLERVVAEILAEPTHPDFAVINGDCAYLKGLPEDYKTLRPLITPLLDAGIPVHLTMGNHDDRGPFFDLFPEAKAEPAPLKDRHLAVIKSKHANWFLLDTLQIVNNVTGEIGAAQREWLTEMLDSHSDKPAILIGHHYTQDLPADPKAKVSGLADSAEFLELLQSKPQVKAYIFGHSHSYGYKKTGEGVHLVNQPPVAYLFIPEKPNGWIKADAGNGGISLTLRALKQEHPENGKTTNLDWR